MLTNYFKTAFRSLWNNKGYSLLNVAGLAIGMGCCLLILLYVTDEKSYDKWLPAIFIASLGLFGLSAYTTVRRSKEIGIRRVLGASVARITAMLSFNFIKLVLAAAVIAVPLSWWAMNKWLDDFAYHIPLSWWFFVSAGITAVSIAIFTVGFQSIKAAISNPVKNLKTE